MIQQTNWEAILNRVFGGGTVPNQGDPQHDPPAPNPGGSSLVRPIPGVNPALSAEREGDTARDVFNRFSPEPEWEKFYNDLINNRIPFAHQNEDLTRNSMRNPNVNDATYRQTLKYSRLADKMNNRYFLRPPDTIGTGIGGQVTGGTQGVTGQQASLYRMPIETEEMRQMQRLREYEALARGRQIGRTEDFRDQSQRLTLAMNLEKLRRSSELANELVYQMVQAPYRQELMRSEREFIAELEGLRLPSEQYNRILAIFRNPDNKMNIFYATMLAGLYKAGIVMPSIGNMLTTPMFSDMIGMVERGDYDALTLMIERLTQMAETGFAAGNEAIQSLIDNRR